MHEPLLANDGGHAMLAAETHEDTAWNAPCSGGDGCCAATPCWYAFPGTASNVQPQPRDAAAQIPTLAEAQAARTKRIPGAIECESLKIISKSDGQPAEPQDMSPWDNARWSQGHHLVVKPGRLAPRRQGGLAGGRARSRRGRVAA
jgi:hypothetical protein